MLNWTVPDIETVLKRIVFYIEVYLRKTELFEWELLK